MSVYHRAWLFTHVSLVVIVSGLIWLPAALDRWGTVVLLPVALLYLAYGAALAWGFRCPRCGRSVYKMHKRLIGVYVPCPPARCRCCGYRLEPRKQS